MRDLDNDAITLGPNGEYRLDPDELGDSYVVLDPATNLEVKIRSERGSGDRWLLFRVQHPHDDNRRREIVLELPPSTRRRRSTDEVKAYLRQLRDHDPLSEDDRLVNKGVIRALEWVLSPDEAASDGAGGENE